MRQYSKNTRFYENPITGKAGQSRYSILHSTACRDANLTPAQYKMLGRALTSPHGLAALAAKGNVLRGMVEKGLVEIVRRPWGEFQEVTEVIEPTEKRRGAYNAVREGA